MTISYDEIRDFLHSEQRALDDKDYNHWLEHYDKNSEFWVPCWDVDGGLTEDPQSEMSLLYYDKRDGIEDRVFRIQTERSSASSLPEPRTQHMLSNLEVLAASSNDAEVRYSWMTHSVRYNNVDTYFGTAFVTLIRGEDGKLKIKRKKAVLKNDYIHHVVDIYHL
ncbi:MULTISPECIES: aromatic-ring-hydroxylating dioxygenase subunit beta [Gammaproteobacteria]|jgi:benzoate/toluate 1,2-dioxygenase beta subunit|uniref:Aromatic-ring-hydroxylating dioxygenase subunit beta n=3 Tax=Gammaproteobacteria TaxID=1236 RepID=A0ABV4W9F2_9GAMM|nr:aromatic-ring-hydroxylating dioxygenase subunit beta [Spongiibacter thalassae]MAO25875.1 benzoate 1,2-dioxygenase small subunit [Roseovarius sp.]MCG2581487.1 benzoate 1,2-dioxygenase small subunit [Marinobacter sp.]MCP4062253.1 benzoate 1,2-dioxygenase small subunit [Gammaproteobacteria bacterium]NKI17879.1 benzoate 1,2-dioxygenase small subunit [Spongiibacter thalassae]|tara:strand:+ start:4368 stop:4862 length:495 start_codon:yes stop_codon:yes gene_type:complete